jgi:hypothetical protein
MAGTDIEVMLQSIVLQRLTTRKAFACMIFTWLVIHDFLPCRIIGAEFDGGILSDGACDRWKVYETLI